MPGKLVKIKPTFFLVYLAILTSGPGFRASSLAASTACSGAENGITFTVATICFGTTTSQCARVAIVKDSSRRLIWLIRSRSITTNPLSSAYKLHRPVKAALRRTPFPFAASATFVAAKSSATSCVPSRAATTFSTPARSKTRVSSRDSVLPFLNVPSLVRIL